MKKQRAIKGDPWAALFLLGIIVSLVFAVIMAKEDEELYFLCVLPGVFFIAFIIRMARLERKMNKEKNVMNTYVSPVQNKPIVDYTVSPRNFLDIQIDTQYTILKDCMYILKSSTNFPTLISRYNLAIDTANKLLEIEQKNMTGTPFFYHNECIKVLTDGEALKEAMIKHFMEDELYHAESLRTVKGKMNRYIAIKSMLLEQQSFFNETEAYKSALKTIDERLAIQESVSKSPKTSTSQICNEKTEQPGEIGEKISYKENSFNSRIPHTASDQYELDEFLAKDFTDTLQKKCRLFKELYSESRSACSTEEEITCLQKCIEAYENAKECFYSYSAGAKIYFQDNYENLRNSNGENCGWSDDTYKRLGELQFRINCLYPYIKEMAVTGFLQTDIYQAFPDHDRAELSKAIDDLYVKGSIQKTKKGSTYLITLAD